MLKGCKLSDGKNKLMLKQFSGAKTKRMKSCIIPTVELNPETIIVHIGTNYSKSDRSREEIAREIINKKTSFKTETK